MPDGRRSRDARVVLLGPLAVLVALLLAVGMPAVARGVEGPGSSCPDTTPAPGSTDGPCEDALPPTRGGEPGGVDLGGILPFLGAGLVGAVLALAAALLVMRRRVPPPLAPAGPAEWWTCSSCGSTNILGSPRCHRCGAWQR